MKKLSILWLSISLIACLNGAEKAQPLLKKKHELPAGAAVNSVNFSYDDQLAAGLQKKEIPLWNFSTGTSDKLYPAAPSRHVTWAPDNIQMAASVGQAIQIINTQNKNSTLVQNSIIPKLPTGVVKYMVPSNPSWNYDGSQLAWGNFQQRGANFVSIWNVAQQRMVHNLRRHKSYVNAVCYNPANAAVLSSGSADSNTGAGLRTATICIWDMRSGQCTKDLRGHGLTKPVSLNWNSNGYLLASASGTTVHIWDIRNNQCFQLPGADARAFLTDLCWHPNGQLLATSSRNQTVRLWDTQNKTCLQVLKADTSSTDHRFDHRTSVQPGVFAVDWNQEGTLLATGAADGIVRLWEYQQKEDDDEPMPADDDSSPPGDDSNQDNGGEEEKETRAMLAVADSEGVSILSLGQDQLQEVDRLSEPNIHYLNYHPTGKLLTLLRNVKRDENTPIINYCEDQTGKLEKKGTFQLKYQTISTVRHPSQKFLAESFLAPGAVRALSAICIYNTTKTEFPQLYATPYILGKITLTYHPSGNFLAATNQTYNLVIIFLFEHQGRPHRIGEYETQGKKSSASTYHPKEPYLVTANTDSNDVTLFKHDINGQLELIQKFTVGEKPIALDYGPTGRTLIVAHATTDNNIVSLRHDKDRLIPLRHFTFEHIPRTLACKPNQKKVSTDQEDKKASHERSN